MPNLRHLKVLNLTHNSLSSPSVARIAALYTYQTARPDRRIEDVDLRNNNLSVHDGQALYDAFPLARAVNGVRLLKHRRDTTLRAIDLSDQSIRIAEVRVLAGLLQALRPQHLTSVNLSRNKINCRGLKELAHALDQVDRVRDLDISHNPVMDGDLDFSGLEALISHVRTSKWLCRLGRDGITGLTRLQEEQLERSLQVNRSLDSQPDETGLVTDKFAAFIRARMAGTVQPLLPAPLLADLDPVFDIDYSFCRINRIPERTVDVSMVGTPGRGFRLGQKYDARVKKKSVL